MSKWNGVAKQASHLEPIFDPCPVLFSFFKCHLMMMMALLVDYYIYSRAEIMPLLLPLSLPHDYDNNCNDASTSSNHSSVCDSSGGGGKNDYEDNNNDTNDAIDAHNPLSYFASSDDSPSSDPSSVLMAAIMKMTTMITPLPMPLLLLMPLVVIITQFCIRVFFSFGLSICFDNELSSSVCR
jgi:hypothetical protein